MPIVTHYDNMKQSSPETSIDVIIPTRNRADVASDLISYLKNELRWPHRIILVDQSDDRGENFNTWLEQECFEDIYHICDEKRGTSAARNTGSLNAQSKWLLFLDDDVKPSYNCLENLLAFISSNPWVEAVQLQVFQKKEWIIYEKDPFLWSDNYLIRKTSRKSPERYLDGISWFLSPVNDGPVTNTLGIGSGAFMISRSAFLSVGGFDEAFVGRGDDREIAVRLWWYGYHVAYVPEAVTFHLRAESGGTRTSKASVAPLIDRLFRPEPEPGLILLYLKWFPGYPLACFLWSYVIKWYKNPFKLIIKLLRLRRSLTVARRIEKIGWKYISNRQPVPRAIAENHAERPTIKRESS